MVGNAGRRASGRLTWISVEQAGSGGADARRLRVLLKLTARLTVTYTERWMLPDDLWMTWFAASADGSLSPR